MSSPRAIIATHLNLAPRIPLGLVDATGGAQINSRITPRTWKLQAGIELGGGVVIVYTLYNIVAGSARKRRSHPGSDPVLEDYDCDGKKIHCLPPSKIWDEVDRR